MTIGTPNAQMNPHNSSRKDYSFMWGKTMERESTPSLGALRGTSNPDERSLGQRAPVSPPSNAAATVGKTMRFRGDMISNEELYLDGELEGTLEVRHRLTIGPNGKIKANVKAKELVVRGSIQGNVEAIDRIVIMNGASIVGDVKTAGIVIEDGAFFKGGIDITRPEVKQPEVATPAMARSQGAG
jgi:cytoskeletal protein CcmA (bactofilin family)